MTTTQELFSYEQAALASFSAAVEHARADGEFSHEVARLEGRLEQLHSVAVVSARQTDDVAQVAAIWQTMVEICEHALARLRELAAAHPGAPISYDKVLDLRSDCRARHAFHA